MGRHRAAEVFPPADPELSLRHVAVILQRPGSGTTLVDCASFALLLFPIAEGDEPWPDDADAAWKRVPDRVYLDSVSADPERWSRPGGVVVRPVPAWGQGSSSSTRRRHAGARSSAARAVRRRRSPVSL